MLAFALAAAFASLAPAFAWAQQAVTPGGFAAAQFE
jgi:hypothetical protein